VSRITTAALIALALLLSGCSELLLNSERINQQFGSYGVDVLQSSASRRMSNLYSMDGEQRICRTLALVTFTDPDNAAIAAEHWEITAGGSIGAVFRSEGWTIEKEHQYVGSIHLEPNATLITELMDIQLPAKLAMHVYEFSLQKPGAQIEYATIIEIHHPDYLSAAQLASIYRATPSQSLSGPATAKLMADVRDALRHQTTDSVTQDRS